MQCPCLNLNCNNCCIYGLHCSNSYDVNNTISYENGGPLATDIDLPPDAILDLAMVDLLDSNEILINHKSLDQQHPLEQININYTNNQNEKIQHSNDDVNLQCNFPALQTNSATPTLSGIYRKSNIAITIPKQEIQFDGVNFNDNDGSSLFDTKLNTVQCCASIDNNSISIKSNNNEENLSSPLDDALTKLASNIYQLAKSDQIVINRKLNEVVRTDANTNQKTIYRVLDPLAMGMKTISTLKSINTKQKPKLGRPPKRNIDKKLKILTAAGASTSQKSCKEKIYPREQNKACEAKVPVPPNVLKLEQPVTRTRYGRVVHCLNAETASVIASRKTKEISTKQPKDSLLSSDPFQMINNNSTKLIGNEMTESLGSMLEAYVAELGDKDYHCKQSLNIESIEPDKDFQKATVAKNFPPQAFETNNTVKAPRYVPPNAICPTCSKIFLGRRLERHFAKHPEHMVTKKQLNNSANDNPNFNPDNANNLTQSTTLFNFLITKLQCHTHLSEEQRADLFLAELNDFVEQLQIRSSRLIRNTSGLHFVNTRVARLLGIPEGQYALDMSAYEPSQLMEGDDTTLLTCYEPNQQTLPLAVSRNIVDYTNLSMSLDDALTDEAAQKLNLSAGGKLLPPSEESLMRAADDLMQGHRMAKLAEIKLNNNNGINGDSVMVEPNSVSVVNKNGMNATNVDSVIDNEVEKLLPHYVHVSDNAVEAVNMKGSSDATILDLNNVDFFSI